MSKRVLAFDFGASGGRAFLAQLNGGKMQLSEVHRFENNPVWEGETLTWDFPALFLEIKQGILKAVELGGFDAVGIDTWGVDFGLIDASGKLIENPVNYRDLRTESIPDEVFGIIRRDELYERSGIQFMRINTLYQLYYLKKYRADLFEKTHKILFMPDLFAYYLTGEMRTEETIASTSNMQNPLTKEWDEEILEKLGIPERIFAKKITPGETYGNIREDLASELGCGQVPVCAVASHDTASAVLAVPAEGGDFVYISCGTWSLFGTELEKPILDNASAKANFTNEGGAGKTIRYLKNIPGLWLFQESVRQWQREGLETDYAVLDEMADSSKPFLCFINPDAPEFETPGDIPGRIREFCRKTGQSIPRERGGVMRCIYESLAMKYRYSLNMLEKLTGKKYDRIHMVGGGIKAKILCRLTASACGVRVLAGPVEATATGNAAVLLMATGEIKDIAGAREIIKDSTDLQIYYPENTGEWDEKYNDFIKILAQGDYYEL